MRKYFILWQDMKIADQWVLGESQAVDGETIDGWHFIMGVPYHGSPPVRVRILQAGKEMPISFGGLNAPHFRFDLATVVENIVGDGIQRFPIEIPGSRSTYEIVNFIKLVDAIDNSSDIEDFTDEEKRENPKLVLRYKYVRQLVLNGARIPQDVSAFRLLKSSQKLIVDDRMKTAIEAICPQHGATFTPVKVV